VSARDLPRGTAFLDELTRALGAGARGVVLAEGDWPASVVAFGERHVLLVRDWPSSVMLSLPAERSWVLETRRELDAALPAIATAIQTWRTRMPPAMSLADLISAILRFVKGVTKSRWKVDFPNDLVPDGATLDGETARIEVAQKGTGFAVRVYVRDEWRTQQIGGEEQLPGLVTWIEKALDDHERATNKWRAELEVASAKKKSEGDAMFADVVEALRRGEQIRRGGGRWSVTYFFEKGAFRRTNFDEGQEDTAELSENALREAVQADPDDFRSVYGSRAGKKKK